MRPMRELLDGHLRARSRYLQVHNCETILGVMKAAQEEKVPIIGPSASDISKLSLEAVGLVTQVARKYIGIFKG